MSTVRLTTAQALVRWMTPEAAPGDFKTRFIRDAPIVWQSVNNVLRRE